MMMSVLALQALVRGLQVIGARRITALRRLDLSRQNPWDPIDEAVMARMFDEIADANEPAVFFRAGFTLSARDVPIVGELFLSGGTVLEGWKLIRRHQALWSHDQPASTIVVEDDALVVGVHCSASPTAHRFAQFTLGSLLATAVEHAGGSAISQLWIGTPDLDVVPRSDVEVVTTAGFYAMRVMRAPMMSPLPSGGRVNATAIERLAARITAGTPRESPAIDAMRYIAQHLSSGPNIRGFARARFTSVRSAQRQLSACGTNFDTLVEQFRRTESDRLLRTPMPVSEIAAALGYGSVQSYTRAHLRWTDATPAARRATATHTEDLRAG